jgi:D-beta-D-heptose 7-phosphate kinase/D-beta-D-heptose 1-phosphate adenosyltransferase
MTLPAEQLVELLNRWRRRKIVVVGDFMLDRYLYGNADRLSPDAPVPVLTAREQHDSPGGAANVCLDLLALQCDVACVGVIGRDDDGRQLRHKLTEAGCHATGLIAAAGKRPTTVKHNFVGLAQHRHPQKMFRVDYEDHSPIDDKTAERVVNAARRQLRGAAALCLEDYNKGVLTETVCRKLIEAARDANVPVFVDPAAIDDYGKYQGATCITPNRTEASLATGRDNGDDLAMARMLLRKLKLDTIVLTLDKHGALLLRKGGKPIRIPTVARAVYDVTGAGDMVLAMLAAAIANDADWPTAVRLANVAAGLEVERFGVVPIELSEVMLSILEQQHEHLGKQRMLDQLVPELDAYRRQGRKIAFTNGCFDILHAGHVSYLREARKQGDLLVVALNSDASIRRIKGNDRPVNHQVDRIMVMSELQSVDYVIVFDEDTPIDLIRAIKPDVLVKGADYRKSEVVGGKDVESFGGKVKLVPLVKGRSTTNIIGKIKGDSGHGG